uniref:FERM_C domain-containing protein n=1 Tax=Brugia timori TaxID=42155 RepID=A0A0R3Q8I8_9BILA
LLDNLYYRDRKFSIEVRNTRLAVFRVSISRRSVASSAIQVHAFYCDTNFLCKTIWSTAIALHQFYLDQRTCCSLFTILIIKSLHVYQVPFVVFS